MSVGIGFPEGIDRDEFLPWGEDGQLVVVRGDVDDAVLVQGALAMEVDLTSWLEAADSLDDPPVSWYEDDEDKPDGVWHAEVAAAYGAQHAGRVRHGWALFWDGADPEDPEGYGDEGGVRLSGEEKPGYVRATWLVLG